MAHEVGVRRLLMRFRDQRIRCRMCYNEELCI